METNAPLQIANELSFDDRQWLDRQLANFDELLRLNIDKSLAEFSQKMVDAICETLKASRGTFYIFEHEDKSLNASATYSIGLDKLPKSRFSIGEGMVGQAAESQQAMYFEDVASDNAIVASGIANLSGRNLVSLPLVFNDQVYGVLEIISFYDIDEKARSLLEKLSRNIALILQSIRNNERNRRLVEELRHQAEEMQAQEEEMRQNVEELEATQEQVEKTNMELNSFKTIVDAYVQNTQDTIFIVDRSYNILLASSTLKDRFRKEGIELKEGMYLPDLIGHEHFEEVWKPRYNRAFAGERFGFTQDRQVGDKTLFVEASVFPVTNESGEVFGCAVVSKDISEYKNAKLRIEELEQELAKLKDNA